jgi:riboflavin kinase/FMN adenylyltransferase
VDIFYVLPFDAEMAAMSDEIFARQVLAEGLGVRHVAAGFDITFGAGRSGDPAALVRYGERFGFSVSITEPVGDPALAKFSSSAARAALQDGQPARAAAIPGRSPSRAR